MLPKNSHGLEMLLDQLDCVIQTPADVEKLERAILSLAVRGKLVPQYPEDEPVAVLLEKIAAERSKLVEEGTISKPKKQKPIRSEDIPYELPVAWKWVRLPEIYYDFGHKKPDAPFTYVDVSSIDNVEGVMGSDLEVIQPEDAPSRARKVVDRGTVIYSTVRPYLLNVAIVDREFDPEPIVSTAFEVMHPYSGVLNRFLFYYLRSQPFIDFVEAQMQGMAYPAISKTKLSRGLFPLPPHEEQKRIVAKVDELFAQTWRLKAQLAQTAESCTTLQKAAVRRLVSAETPAQRSDAWHLIAGHFHTLYDAPAHIDDLKQTILQLAVQGRLVPQDPEEEPASALLERIAAEKKRLVESGEIRKPKKLKPISDSKTASSLPANWDWERLGNIALDIHYGYTASADDMLRDVRLLRITDIQNNRVNWDTVPGCVIEDNDIPKYVLKENDILIARTGGTVGKSYLVEQLPVRAVFASYLIRIIPPDNIDARYLKLFLESPSYWEQLRHESKGTGQPNVNATSLSHLTVPIPPLKEQKRIVTQVNGLLTLCDRLTDHVTAAHTTRERLLEALLAGAA